ncbi:MAG: XRE family transcriptional regulator [Bacteroidales bacterium]|nr:XRE family transcriptional regulator [Bacteroidales bacterium]
MGTKSTNSGNIHIGSLIEAQLKRDERSASWLARQIPCTRNHVYKIFRKSSIDCALLLRISKAMQFNFFQYYAANVGEAMAERLGTHHD